jgi:molybdenum cofactor cytidylyltransferase
MTSRPAVIVLAAGRGSRFLGTDHKLMQSLGGLTVLGTTLRQAIASQLPVVVVTTAALAEIACRSVAARDVVIVPEVGSTAASGQGMGHSIAAGVSARSGASGWLILPGDMPQVQPATLQAVARQLAQNAVVYAQYKGRRGHPVGFSSELYSELAALTGDEGARRLIARYPALGLEVDDPGVLVDVDTLDDLDAVRRASVSADLPQSRW